VLVRSVKSEGAVIASALEERAVPARTCGAAAYFQRAEVRDVLAWLRALADPNDSGAVVRALSRPPIELRQVDGLLAAHDGGQERPVHQREVGVGQAGLVIGQRFGQHHQVSALLRRRAVIAAFDLDNDVESVLKLLQKYADVPMSLADACLDRLAALVAHLVRADLRVLLAEDVRMEDTVSELLDLAGPLAVREGSQATSGRCDQLENSLVVGLEQLG
jgi:ATP-dependent exoDNAse (exonuclease V) beta subunit